MDNQKKPLLKNKNFYIKGQDHTKLYVLPKDQIVFESKMEQNNLPYYFDINSQPFTDTGLRYFILDSDRPRTNQILKENEIIASTETIPSYDYRDQKKITKLTLIIAGIVVILMVLLILI